MTITRYFSSIASCVFVGLAAFATVSQAAPVLAQVGYSNAVVATFAGPNSNIFGSVSSDAAGNRYVVTGFTQALYKVSSTGVVSGYANPTNGSSLLSSTVVGNDLYLSAESSALSRVDLTTGAITNLASSVGSILSMAYGAGKLFVGTTGGVYAYDTATNAYALTPLSGGFFTGMAFANDGRLLVSDYQGGRILSYDTATNTSNVFRSGLANIGGLAVHKPTGLVYAALEGSHQLMEIVANGSSATVFASNMPIDGGYYPTALGFSHDGSELYYLNRGVSPQSTLSAIRGFSSITNDVPEPGALALVMLGLAGAFVARRRTQA